MASIPINQSIVTETSERTWQFVELGERIFAGILLIALSPFLCAVWIAILVLSRRSPLIAHRRVGLHNSELWVLKFRTMWDDRKRGAIGCPLSVEYIDDQVGPDLKGPGDPRVRGWFARFCRQHSVDELPQLIHVLRGEMSLVGPRPVTHGELHRIYGSSAAQIVAIKPGITGLWQVSGRNRLTPEERCCIDLECVRTRSFQQYCRILWRTIPEVFSGADAW